MKKNKFFNKLSNTQYSIVLLANSFQPTFFNLKNCHKFLSVDESYKENLEIKELSRVCSRIHSEHFDIFCNRERFQMMTNHDYMHDGIIESILSIVEIVEDTVAIEAIGINLKNDYLVEDDKEWQEYRTLFLQEQVQSIFEDTRMLNLCLKHDINKNDYIRLDVSPFNKEEKNYVVININNHFQISPSNGEKIEKKSLKKNRNKVKKIVKTDYDKIYSKSLEYIEKIRGFKNDL
ncbi:MAG: hypothetical protein JKY89_07275 [Immundisolibacteraceae bacterium]|nr:hypothetical protein [Immundisolibacteraceae bacterium]